MKKILALILSVFILTGCVSAAMPKNMDSDNLPPFVRIICIDNVKYVQVVGGYEGAISIKLDKYGNVETCGLE